MVSLSEVLGDLPHGVLVEDADARVIWVNQAFCDLLGIRAAAGGWAGAECAVLFASATTVPELPGFLAGTTHLRAAALAQGSSEDRVDLRGEVTASREAVASRSGVMWILRAPSTQSESSAPDASPAASGAGRVLVAEDNAVNRILLVRMLEVLEVSCDVVEDGEQALEALARHPYAVVLMDVSMPELDGRAATRRLRSIEGARHTPVIALTASTSLEERRLCEQAGMDDFLAKPASLADLRAALAPYVAVAAESEAAPAPVLDDQRLRDLDDQLGDPALVRETVQTYLEELENRVAGIEQAISLGDRDTLELTAHSLKSSSAMLGAYAMSRRCARLEAMAHSSTTEELTRASSHLRDLQRATATALHEWASR